MVPLFDRDKGDGFPNLKNTLKIEAILRFRFSLRPNHHIPYDYSSCPFRQYMIPWRRGSFNSSVFQRFEGTAKLEGRRLSGPGLSTFSQCLVAHRTNRSISACVDPGTGSLV